MPLLTQLVINLGKIHHGNCWPEETMGYIDQALQPSKEMLQSSKDKPSVF